MDYRGSLIYVKTASGHRLSEVHFGEGMFSVSPDGRVDVRWFVKDHLGSVRAVTDGQGNVLERNDYYPFGARHLRSNQAQSVNRYKYNGKEEQRTGGLGYLDYGARMYDAALGRWFSIDPLAEQYAARSVYHFCGNNPLLLVDGNGMSYDDYRDIPPYRWEDDSGLNSDPRPHTIINLKSRGWEKRYVRGWDPTPWYSDDASSHSNPADLRDMTNILSTTSVLMSVFGGLTENSKATFRITNSKGVFDFKFMNLRIFT